LISVGKRFDIHGKARELRGMPDVVFGGVIDSESNVLGNGSAEKESLLGDEADIAP